LNVNADSPSIQPDVDIFEIDMFLHQNTGTISSLHALGKKVICYFSGGSYEPDRPDSSKFPAADLGNELKGWPGERWLNLNSTAIRDIMAARIDIAAHMGCDAVDPDNVDGYQNDNGLDLTSDESVDFVTFLANKAHEHNLAIGLKNAGDIVPDVLPLVQFAVNEQCAQYKNCGIFRPFIKANKPVLQIEYPEGAPDNISEEDMEASCASAGSDRFSTVLKALSLGSGVQYCDGTLSSTAVYR
jgi:hypothetical protein